MASNVLLYRKDHFPKFGIDGSAHLIWTSASSIDGNLKPFAQYNHAKKHKKNPQKTFEKNELNTDANRL